MDLDDANLAEWENQENWSGPKWASVYFSKRDTRTVVPKQLPWMGWTVNLARTAGVFWLMGVLVGIPLLVIVIVLLTGGGE